EEKKVENIVINGREIINYFKLTESPKIGELKKAVLEAQLRGEVINKKEALVFLKRLLKESEKYHLQKK
ncbi:MAG: hypothetical protein KAS39_02400, partial [Actinomycetia bacterium]|nr:hypothetical protein [Actinomycetes bacterium]